VTERQKPGASSHGYERVADALVEAGVECIFGVLGDDTGPLIHATSQRGIRYIFARHENQAVSMADGYSRATGRTGVATVTTGPGLSNAITAIHSAHRGNSRICVLVGAGNVEENDLDPDVVRSIGPASWLKFFPQTAVLKQIGVCSVKPTSAGTAWRETRKAMDLAASRTVVLVLPRNALDDAVVEEAKDYMPENHQSSAPDAGQVSSLADLLQESWAINRPVILAGRGAVNANAGASLARLGELTGALLATSLPANGMFYGNPFNIGICGTYATSLASEFITQADCVLAFGAGLNALTTYKNSLFPKAMVVQVDLDPNAFGKFVDIEMGIHGDCKDVADMLIAELEKRSHKAEGFRTAQVRDAIAGFSASAGIKDKSTEQLIDPRTLMIELDRILPGNRILCADGGQQSRFSIRYIHVEKARNFMQASEAGSIGLGMGLAIGTAVARPGELVVASIGDASMMMALGDLETAVRLKLPILVLVVNDEALGSEVNFLLEQGLPTEVALTQSPSFAAIAQSMGAHAATVRNIQDLKVIEPWLKNPDVPLVLDCRINPDIRAHFL